MFAIDYSAQAHRALGAMSSSSRRLICQLLKAVAEMAELFPNSPDVWRRLGRVTDRTVDVCVEQFAVRVEISARGVVRVLKITESRGGARRRLPTTSKTRVKRRGAPGDGMNPASA